MSSGSSLQPARQSASSTSSAVTDGQASSQSLGSSTRNRGASATSALIPTSLCWDRHSIQFAVNAWVLVVVVLAIFPLVPKNLSNIAYRLSFLGTLCSSLYSLYSSYGKPRAWNIWALLTYFWTVITAKDFLYFIYGLTFATSNLYPTYALFPVLCRALEHVVKFLRGNFSRSCFPRFYHAFAFVTEK